MQLPMRISSRPVAPIFGEAANAHVARQLLEEIIAVLVEQWIDQYFGKIRPTGIWLVTI
jgi:hypothetical protein